MKFIDLNFLMPIVEQELAKVLAKVESGEFERYRRARNGGSADGCSPGRRNEIILSD